jgi:hypothetical protein
MPMLSWLFSRITGEAIKTGGEVAKTATEIPKNLIETEKARLEVEQLKFERAERQHLITTATFEDVKQYDPNVKSLHERFQYQQQQQAPADYSLSTFELVLWLCAGIGAIALIFWLITWIIRTL